jgi:hypothetical protein
MPRTNLWDRSVPRVEVDRRSREARLRFERIDQLFIVRATVTPSRLRRLFYLFTVGRYGGCRKRLSRRTARRSVAFPLTDPGYAAGSPRKEEIHTRGLRLVVGLRKHADRASCPQ